MKIKDTRIKNYSGFENLIDVNLLDLKLFKAYHTDMIYFIEDGEEMEVDTYNYTMQYFGSARQMLERILEPEEWYDPFDDMSFFVKDTIGWNDDGDNAYDLMSSMFLSALEIVEEILVKNGIDTDYFCECYSMYSCKEFDGDLK